MRLRPAEKELSYDWREWVKKMVMQGYASRDTADRYAKQNMDRRPSEADDQKLYLMDCLEYAEQCRRYERGHIEEW